MVEVAPGISVRAHYAGHVLGAAMFEVNVAGQRVLYTGDYNMTPDRHLRAASVGRINPDVLITETTYATTIRDSKRYREQDFLQRVKQCVLAGGKVLIPVFALGRAQELCILLDAFWTRMQLGSKAPIYFSAGLTTRANDYFKMYVNWTNEKIKHAYYKEGVNQFDFPNIKPFDRAYMNHPGPMVVFATPGMLHAGLALELFRAWGSDPKNLVVIPGYCVAGTVGNKILSGQKEIEVEKGVTMTVRCEVAHLSFSAHADALGIMTLLRQANPRSVVLVHGEKDKMIFLKERINRELNLPCYCPANGSSVTIPRPPKSVPGWLSVALLAEAEQRAVEQHDAMLLQYDHGDDDDEGGNDDNVEYKGGGGDATATSAPSISSTSSSSSSSSSSPSIGIKRVREEGDNGTEPSRRRNAVDPSTSTAMTSFGVSSPSPLPLPLPLASSGYPVRGIAVMTATDGVRLLSENEFARATGLAQVVLALSSTVNVKATWKPPASTSTSTSVSEDGDELERRRRAVIDSILASINESAEYDLGCRLDVVEPQRSTQPSSGTTTQQEQQQQEQQQQQQQQSRCHRYLRLVGSDFEVRVSGWSPTSVTLSLDWTQSCDAVACELEAWLSKTFVTVPAAVIPW